MAYSDRETNKGFISSYFKFFIPITNAADRLGCGLVIDRLAIKAIRDYQKYISPHKGFCCAHKKLYGSHSCSEYFRQTIHSYGFISAVPLFQERLEVCKLANLKLKAEIGETSPKDRQKKEERKKKKNNVQNDNCLDDSSCNGCDK